MNFSSPSLPLIQHVDQFLQQFDFCHQNVIHLASAGVDSIVLLHLLKFLQKKHRFVLHIAHIHHNTGRLCQTKEQNFIHSLCQKEKLPYHTITLKKNTSFHIPESDLRQKRYDFLKQIAKKIQASYGFTAHHQNDQIETILLRIFQGSRIFGRKGIKPLHPLSTSLFLLRPLLSIPKKDIINFKTKFNLSHYDDSSNLDTRYTRNALRHIILPEIKKAFSQNIDKTLLNFAKEESEIASYLFNKSKEKLKKISLSCPYTQTINIDLQQWNSLSCFWKKKYFQNPFRFAQYSFASMSYSIMPPIFRFAKKLQCF